MSKTTKRPWKQRSSAWRRDTRGSLRTSSLSILRPILVIASLSGKRSIPLMIRNASSACCEGDSASPNRPVDRSSILSTARLRIGSTPTELVGLFIIRDGQAPFKLQKASCKRLVACNSRSYLRCRPLVKQRGGAMQSKYRRVIVVVLAGLMLFGCNLPSSRTDVSPITSPTMYVMTLSALQTRAVMTATSQGVPGGPTPAPIPLSGGTPGLQGTVVINDTLCWGV